MDKLMMEIENTYKKETNRMIKDEILLSCSDDFKLKEISNYDGDIYDFLDFFKDEKKKLLAFEYFIKEKKVEIPKYALSSFVEIFEDKFRVECIKLFLNSGIMDQSFLIPDLFDKLSDDLKDSVLPIFYEYEDEMDVLLVTDAVIASILLKYSTDKFLEKFDKFVLKDSSRFDAFSVISEFFDINRSFLALNSFVKDKVSNLDERGKGLFLLELKEHLDSYENDFPNGNLKCFDLVEFFVERLELNRDHLYELINKCGYLTLRYLDSDNIVSIINMDSNNFKKFINLFKRDNLKLNDDSLNTAINAILQREFIFKCSDEYNIFAKLKELINSVNIEGVEEIILQISEDIAITKILDKYNISLDAFLDSLISGDKKMLDILHNITDKYISKRREKYANKRLVNIKEKLNLEKKYEKNFIKKKYIATMSFARISDVIMRYISDDELTEKQQNLKNNETLIEKIINFRKGAINSCFDNEVSKNLKVFDSLLDILYDNDLLIDPTGDVNAKYVYLPKESDGAFLLSIMADLDVDSISKFLLSNDELLNRLNYVFDKYKLIGWNNIFDNLIKEADLEFNSDTLSGIINYFYKIYPEISNDFRLTKLISLGNCYVSSSDKYRLLFGEDVYNLIVANEGKNRATMIRYKRLFYAVNHVVRMYNRNSVPIPSMDTDIELDNGKKLNVVVGNVTNMNNLVLGELTDSCMRIGGDFYDFYEECLEGNVGFNIVFSNSDTGEFVTRVSGIRNGNTLFLNELRDSVSVDYDNEDCVSAIKIVADMLVEKSKISEFPIDNVVITADCAMIDHEYELQDLHLVSRNRALFGLRHNLNSKGKAIVLATSKGDNSLVDIKLGKDKISYYLPQRDKVRLYSDEEARHKVIQLKYLLNELLNGEELGDIDIDINVDVVKCIAGSDWYISLDSKGNIERFVLDNSNDRDRAMKEMNSYLLAYGNELDEIKRGVVR